MSRSCSAPVVQAPPQAGAVRRAVGAAVDRPRHRSRRLRGVSLSAANRNRGELGVLAEKGDAVIAVGSWHLPGKDGLVNLLQQAGYKVERVLFNWYRW